MFPSRVPASGYWELPALQAITGCTSAANDLKFVYEYRELLRSLSLLRPHTSPLRRTRQGKMRSSVLLAIAAATAANAAYPYDIVAYWYVPPQFLLK